ncbi:MAG: acetylornithine deacetylase [Hyphomicrobiaceae bacterium]|nr:acetylornithine deacetylase [Hyphomicrobiaceae bacterium]
MAAPVAAAKDLLARLVGFDTTSHKSNLPIIGFIADYLRQHGVQSTLVPTPDGQKASLFATIGPTGVGGVALSGHTDVVPVDGQTWSSDPFTLVERDGKLHGRGACDMKGYLACVLAMVPEFKARKLATPIHVAFSYDEEVGCTGVRPMIAELGASLPRPSMVLVGEPTSMMVVDAHKGPMRWVVRLTGRAAHSSMPHLGVNAITYAGQLLGELARIEAELKGTGLNSRFDPPYTTLQVTQMAGGNASNIVPTACWFGWEIRRLPGFDAQALDARFRGFAEERCAAPMRQVDADAGVSIELTNEVPPFQADPRSRAVPLTLKLAQQNDTFAVCYATEASLFQEGGAPAVVCGPGNIAQAHTPDEYIEIGELEKCLAFLSRLADWTEG